jgi:hypothetical protein
MPHEARPELQEPGLPGVGHAMRIALAILLLLAACAPSHSANQAPQPMGPIAPGDRLRVTHDGHCCTSPSIGLEQSLSRDSLVLQPERGAPRIAIARSNITQIERWKEGRTHRARDALLGFLAGAAAGGLSGYQSACGHCDGDWRPFGAILGVIGGGSVGLLAGFVVGLRHGFWEIVPQLTASSALSLGDNGGPRPQD